MGNTSTEPFGGNMGPTALPLVRISYAQGLHRPQQNESGGDRYSVTLIFPADKTQVLQQKIAEVVGETWGEKGFKRFKEGMIKNPIIAGDGKQARDREGEIKPGMGPDVVFIRTSSKFPAKVLGPDSLPMDPTEIKSGWYGYPVLNAFSWSNAKNGDGVSFGLNWWMHAKEGEVLGGDGGVGDPSKFFEQIATGGASGQEGRAPVGNAGDLFS